MIWSKLHTFFDADTGGAGSGGDAPEVTPPAADAVVTSAPASAPADAVTPAQTPTPAGGDTAGANTTPGVKPITLTSAQLTERLDRAKGAERQALAKSMGFDNVDALQVALDAGKKALEAQKTAEERQADALKQATDRAAALERQVADALSQRDKLAIRTAAFEKMGNRFIDPGAAFKLMPVDQFKLDDSGEVVGLADAIEQLAQQYPWALSKQAPPAQEPAKKIEPKITPNPEGTALKTSDEERRARYFGDNGRPGFFTPRSDGVKAVAPSKQK